MTTIATPANATQTTPVVGIFDDIGVAEHAVFQLHDAGFGGDVVSLTIDVVESGEPVPMAPPSRALPYAFLTSIVGGALLGILSARFAPHTLTVQGFGWQLSSVLLFSLLGGTFGWILGGILGLGETTHEDEEPEAHTTLQQPQMTVTVRAMDRPQEARAILNRSRPREVRGGDPVVSRVDARPRSGGAAPARTARGALPAGAGAGSARETAGGGKTAASGLRRVTPSPHDAEDKRRAGVAVVAAIALGAIVGLLRSRHAHDED